MPEHSGSWPYQVEIEVPRADFDAKLRAVEAWLLEWEIPHRIGSSLGALGRMRVCFAEEKLARAFRNYHGGQAVPADEVTAALAADADDEELYDRLAGEYRDEQG